ncbi:hypothetical protein [Hymenobacter sp. DG25B]|uniref:hypothetical protein n=1 Tax=Hymenobacter sp. DG25B TaxID=1385664 RepID=UPI0012E0231D|nr:hypothetical protein [Hymenobacter sp. DG25B]
MKTETINRVILNSNNELLLILAGPGKPMYQYVYREAAGVYWDNSQKGFRSTPLREWTISDWFMHIKEIVKTSLNVDLKLSNSLIWENIPEIEQTKIKSAL